MKKVSASELSTTLAHNQVPRKALIQVGDLQSKIQTINDAWLEPKKSFPPHKHDDCEEIYYFLEGEGEMKVAGQRFNVKTGDCVVVEEGEPHALKNTSFINLRFIAIRALL